MDKRQRKGEQQGMEKIQEDPCKMMKR